jgi:hypothetical protein
VNMALKHPLPETQAPSSPRLYGFLIGSVLIHICLFFGGLLFGGVYGVPGPGGGDALTFQLAAGDAHDRFAAPLAEVTVPNPKPPVEKPKVEPQPAPKPKPKPEVAPRKAKNEKMRPEVKDEPKPEPESEPQLTLQEQLAAMGAAGGKGGGGAHGYANETILNKKGTSLTGAMISTQMPGRTFELNIFGRGDIQGVNNAINTRIKLNPDGTSEVQLTHYFFQTYHSQYSSTRSESASGHWWIEGNRWCHQSEAINYNTKDCYDMTTDGTTLRLYYAPCGQDSSTLCRSGRLAGIGTVQ